MVAPGYGIVALRDRPVVVLRDRPLVALRDRPGKLATDRRAKTRRSNTVSGKAAAVGAAAFPARFKAETTRADPARLNQPG